MRRTVVNAFAHQDLPFPLLVERLVTYRDPSRTPIFQVLFSLNQAYQLEGDVGSMASVEAGGGGDSATFALGKQLRMQHYPVDQGVSPFDLQFVVSEGKEQLSASLQYNVAIFEPSTIARMASHIMTVLEAVSAPDAPACAIGDLPLMSPAEERRVLIDWNDTFVEYPTDRTAAQLFEERVESCPTATAVVEDSYALTYEEFNARANTLAWYLHWRGVRAGTFVGILMYRSVDYLVALMGIAKAGGAYVPIDPAYPVERIRY